MEKAALKAESLGEMESAKEIREDYTAFSDPNRCWKPTTNMIYSEVQDAVIERPEWSFEEAINFVAHDSGMTSEQFLVKYERSRAIYEDAKSITRRSMTP